MCMIGHHTTHCCISAFSYAALVLSVPCMYPSSWWCGLRAPTCWLDSSSSQTTPLSFLDSPCVYINTAGKIQYPDIHMGVCIYINIHERAIYCVGNASHGTLGLTTFCLKARAIARECVPRKTTLLGLNAFFASGHNIHAISAISETLNSPSTQPAIIIRARRSRTGQRLLFRRSTVVFSASTARYRL